MIQTPVREIGAARRDLTLIVVSHNLAVVRLIADDAAVMHRGKLVEQGPASVVFESPAAEYTRRPLASWPRLREPRHPRESRGP